MVKRNAKMDEVGRLLGIDGCINLNQSTGGKIQKGGKVVADAIEAIIGAVYLDCGEDMALTGQVIETLGLKLPEELPEGFMP